jgi:hypothetical protein
MPTPDLPRLRHRSLLAQRFLARLSSAADPDRERRERGVSAAEELYRATLVILVSLEAICCTVWGAAVAHHVTAPWPVLAGMYLGAEMAAWTRRIALPDHSRNDTTRRDQPR